MPLVIVTFANVQDVKKPLANLEDSVFRQMSGEEICKGEVVVDAMVIEVRTRVPESARKRELWRLPAEFG